MICPDCRTENIPGSDLCDGCGSDLRNLDLPEAKDVFTSHFYSDQLGDLGVEQSLVVSPGDPVAYAVHIMQTRNCECILVTEDAELVGILTEQDILLKTAGDKVDLNAVAVEEIMTPDPVILREDDTLAVALHKMSIGGFRHIPLEKDRRATRVVSIQDVFRHICSFIDEETDGNR